MDKSAFTMFVENRDIKEFGIRLVGYETQPYVARKTAGVDIPGAHGTATVPSALDSNSFKTNFVCSGNSATEVNVRIRQFFAFLFSSNSPKKMVFSDNKSVIRHAFPDSPQPFKVVEGVDNAVAEFEVTFYMPDPFMYNSEHDRVVEDAAHGKEILVYNEAFECPAIYTLRNVGSTQVTDAAIIVNGELASFSCVLRPGDEIVLDVEEYEVRFNGEMWLDLWRGEMPLLRNGENIIIQQNTQHENLLLTVDFVKRWV